MDIKNNIKTYYAYQFFKSLFFWIPISILYFQSNGLTYLQIMTLFVLQSGFQILFEVPSGVFADFFGRRGSLIIGAISRTIGMLLYFLGDSFSTFLVAASVYGISFAFDSGSDSALVYDTLKILKKTAIFKKVEGTAFSFSMMGLSVAALIGGYLGNMSFKLALLATVIGVSTSVVLAMLLVEPKRTKPSEDTTYFRHMIDASKFAFTHPKVKWLVLYYAVCFTSMTIVFRYVQPYMNDAGIDLKYFGLFYFSYTIVSSLSSRFAHNIESKMGEFGSLLIIPLSLSLMFFLVGNFILVYGLVFFMVESFMWGYLRPVVYDYIHYHVESHHRATVISLNGFISSLIVMIVSPISGWIADTFRYTYSFFFQAVIVSVFGIVLAVLIKNSNKKLY